MALGIYAHAAKGAPTTSGWVRSPRNFDEPMSKRRFKHPHVTFDTREEAEAWLKDAFTFAGVRYEIKEYTP